MIWFVLGYALVVLITIALCKAASSDREYIENYDEKQKDYE
ncbi:hypothetical protein J2Z53_002041 [Clostridium moniliforme]|uniref:Uncharacterized protein n=1 Tax=Clostridium moniliforme TaxID=39489 RepID=A0ABS4F2H9_9CLOT|nr:hypothetical protein [Clostridium moniliforme]MBP1890446.1 hypothetical protein [Clostridium moniliforme]